jgi:hypothetical protein
MPHAFPPHIQQILDQKMPPGYELYWVRALVTGVKLKTLGGVYFQGSTPSPFTVIQCFDIDAAAQDGAIKAYDINLRGDQNKYEAGDPISFFGHRRIGETRVRPHFICNHNIPRYEVAYYDMVQEDGHRGSDFTAKKTIDKWLFCSVHRKGGSKLKQYLYGLFSYFSVTGIILLICAALAYFNSSPGQSFIPKEGDNSPQIAFGIYVAIGLVMGLFAVGDHTEEVDLQPIYKEIQTPIHVYVQENPAPEMGFVVNSRSRGD